MKALFLSVCTTVGAQALAMTVSYHLSLDLGSFWTWTFGVITGFVCFDSVGK